MAGERGDAAEGFVTGATLEAVLNVLKVWLEHLDRVAGNAQTGMVAARDLLVSKGIVSAEEWDTAYDRVETDQRVLFSMDAEVPAALDELQRLVSPEEKPDAGAPEEGGEA
jgi:hypothetical protein